MNNLLLWSIFAKNLLQFINLIKPEITKIFFTIQNLNQLKINYIYYIKIIFYKVNSKIFNLNFHLICNPVKEYQMLLLTLRK